MNSEKIVEYLDRNLPLSEPGTVAMFYFATVAGPSWIPLKAMNAQWIFDADSRPEGKGLRRVPDEDGGDWKWMP